MPFLKPRGPTIIALQHPIKEDAARCEKIRDALEEISRDGKKRTLFVELSQGDISLVLDQKPKTRHELIQAINLDMYPEPFAEAVRVAYSKGYKIVGLMSPSVTRFIDKVKPLYRHFPSRRKELLKVTSYVNKNLMEPFMAKRLAKHKPTSNDIIIMHPNHVKGFLAEVDFKPKSIKWLDRPRKRGQHDVWRLKGRELRDFLKEREIRRKERQRIAFARKRI